MDSERLRRADEELAAAKHALDTARDRLATANSEVVTASRIKYPIRTTLSFDRSKDQNWDEAISIGLNDDAIKVFIYEVLDLTVGVEISEDGNVTILSIDGVDLKTPVVIAD